MHPLLFEGDKYNPKERFPIGEYLRQATMEQIGSEGGCQHRLPTAMLLWAMENISYCGTHLEWHIFLVSKVMLTNSQWRIVVRGASSKMYLFDSLTPYYILQPSSHHLIFYFTHIPVTPCESAGFSLKPDGFSNVPPETNEKSDHFAPGCCAVQR